MFEAYLNTNTKGKEMNERKWWYKNICISVGVLGTMLLIKLFKLYL